MRSVEVGYRNTAQTRVAEESLMLTSDQNIIDVQLSVQYDIKDARAFLFNNASRERDARTSSSKRPKPRSAKWWAATRSISC